MQGKYKIAGMGMKDYEIRRAMLNSNVLYAPTCVEYTIRTSGFGLDPTALLNSGAYLPRDYELFCTKIEVNDIEVTDLNIEVGNIKKIKLYYNKDLTSMSFENTKIKTLNYMYTDNFTTMERMFYGCSELEEVNGIFITDKVTNMSKMFYGCCSLTKVKNTHIWKTRNVTDMSYMFSGCNMISDLNFSGWDTRNVKNMCEMFAYCWWPTFTTLDLSSFNTRKVTNMRGMFYGCHFLTSLDISSFNTGNVKSCKDMFHGIGTQATGTQITGEIDWNYSDGKYEEFFLSESETSYGYDFPWLENCILYTIRDIQTDQSTSIWDKVNRYYSQDDTYPYLPYEYGQSDNGIESIKVMFNNRAIGYSMVRTDLENIQICDVNIIKIKYSPKVNTIKFKGSRNCPHNISNLKRMRNFHLTSMSNMFAFTPYLEYITPDISNWDTSGVTSMYRMFYNDINSVLHITLKDQKLDLSNWDVSGVTDMSYMFYDCKIKSLDLSNWNTGNVKDMDYMFRGCGELTSLNVSNWDTSKVRSMSSMFYECSLLKSLDLSSWNTNNVTYWLNMFYLMYGAKIIIDDDIWNPAMTEDETDFSGTFTII